MNAQLQSQTTRQEAEHDIHRNQAQRRLHHRPRTQEDERGFFARAFCQNEFREHGLKPIIAQANIAFNLKQGHACAGCIFSIRRPPRPSWCAARAAPSSTSSSTCGPRARPTSQHIAVELNEDNIDALYVPERFAHGYQALRDNTETSYQVGEFYAPSAEGGLRLRRSATGPAMAAAGVGDLAKDLAFRPSRNRGGRETQDVPVTSMRDGRSRRRMPQLQIESERRSNTMWIVDTALKAREEQGRPIRVGIIGAGFMGQGLTNQIVHSVPGMRVVAISNRQVERALSVFTVRRLRRRRRRRVADGRSTTPSVAGKPVVTEDAMLLARSEQIDVLVDVTGSVEFGAQVVLEAFKHGKDVVLMNAELDATIGPILQIYADKHGVILVGLRRRRARRADEPLSLGQGARSDAARDGQRQGASGPLSQSDDAAGLRRAVGAEPGDGDELRRRLEDQLRAGHRRERHGLQGRSRGMSRGLEYTGRRHGDRRALRRRGAAQARRHRSTTSLARR